MDLWDGLNEIEIARQLNEYFGWPEPAAAENQQETKKEYLEPTPYFENTWGKQPSQFQEDEDDYFDQIAGLLNKRDDRCELKNQKKEPKMAELEKYLETQGGPGFTQVLFELMDKKGQMDVEVYKRAWLDRRVFSKLRSKPGYRPSKPTVLALVLAVKANREQAQDLLGAAGYGFSGHDTTDLTILYCIEHEVYDLHQVNGALEYLGQKLLGTQE